MYAHPGKKLLFMGDEIGQRDEWNHDQSLDWHLLEYAPHKGVQELVRDLNRLYRGTPALHEVDFDDGGFEWIDWNDSDSSVLSWVRRDKHGGHVVCVVNMTPIVRDGYRFGVPDSGTYKVLLNTDEARYGGSDLRHDHLDTHDIERHGRPHSLQLSLPPLATLILQPAH